MNTAHEDVAALFGHVEPGPRFAKRDIVRAVVRATGASESAVNARVEKFAVDRLIHTRPSEGSTCRNFSGSDLGAAAILSGLIDTGAVTKDVQRAVSQALYAWTPGVRQTTPHPILAAVVETLNGSAFWCLQVDAYRHLQTGEQTSVASFFRSGEIDPGAAPDESDVDPRNDPNCLPALSLMVPVSTFLTPLAAILAPEGN